MSTEPKAAGLSNTDGRTAPKIGGTTGLVLDPRGGASLRERIAKALAGGKYRWRDYLDDADAAIVEFVVLLRAEADEARRKRTPYYDAQAKGFDVLADELEERDG